MTVPRVSIVIPVFNEAPNLPELLTRLSTVMDGLAGGAEAIVVDDGSSDGSMARLREAAARDPRVRVVSFNANYGQRAAVFAGVEIARGRIVVTIDGDLQNPPEDIPALVAKIDEGFDVVGGWRQHRKDPLFRRWSSRVFNAIMRAAIPEFQFHDIGCMMRAYSRPVVDAMLQCGDRSPYLPALSCQFTQRIAEVPVTHAARRGGTSRYGPMALMRLQADLITGFTSTPLKLTSIVGALIAVVSILFGVFLGIRRLIHGPEAEGVFTLFAILFFLVGANFLALGLLGEYVGRIYIEVRRRPRSVVAERINVDATDPHDRTPS